MSCIWKPQRFSFQQLYPLAIYPIHNHFHKINLPIRFLNLSFVWDNFQCQTHFLLLFKRRKWFKIIIICRSRNTKMAIAMIFKRTFISVQVFMFYLDLKCSQSQDKAICRFNYIVIIIIPRLIINMTYYWNDNKS